MTFVFDGENETVAPEGDAPEAPATEGDAPEAPATEGDAPAAPAEGESTEA